MNWIRANEYMTMRTNKLTAIAFCMAAILLQAVPGAAQTYTLAPTPFQTALDDSGKIIVNGCVWTYAAGTSTPIATYSTNAGAVSSNPIIADYAGRFTVYLLAGTNYKFVYETACSPPAHGTTTRTQDNITGLPGSSATVDVQGTAGETLSAGVCAYLSDGSGSKAAGQWFRCDSTNTYSSTTPETGMTVASITSGSSGTIRLAGSVTGLSSLSIGAEYFVGAAGALTLTAPANSRHLGHADSATSLVLTGNPSTPQNVDNGIQDLRLTLTTGVPVTTADVTAATTIYLSPYRGNRIALFNAAGLATTYTTAEISIAVPATTATMYDVFCFSNAGVPALELLAWTNVTTRATAVVLTTTGVYTKSADLTRRYLGSFLTTTVSGQTEDSAAKRNVWNMYNRVGRSLIRKESTASWTWATGSWHQANAAAANQVGFVIGIAEVLVDATVTGAATQAAISMVNAGVALGLDSTTVPSGLWSVNAALDQGGVIASALVTGFYREYPAVGSHFLAWLEFGNTNTLTYYGNGTPTAGSGGGSPTVQSGITGRIEG